MRILFLTNFYPPHDIGGYEQWCQAVAEGLIARGHTIRVLAGNWRRQHATDVSEPHVNRTLHLQADLNHYQPRAFFTVRRARERANLRRLQAAVADFRPDIVFVWGMWNFDRSLPRWLEAQPDLRVAYYISDLWPKDPDIHTAYWSQPPAQGARARPWQAVAAAARGLLRLEGKPVRLRFQHAITVSEAIRRELIVAGLPFESARVIHGGCDAEAFTPRPSQANRAPGCLSVVYVGGLASHKGVNTILQAFAKLQPTPNGETISLDLIGGGHPDYVARLEEFVRQRGLTAQTHFRGRVPLSDIPTLLRQYDGLIFASEWQEPFARTPMEAMLAGVPVISTMTGGTPELVEPQINALVFEAGDADGLASQIRRLAWNPELAQQLAEVGRATVLKRFSLTRMITEIEGYLARLVSENEVQPK